jgi:succinoglycan biosynthesis transport protein ExoP
MRVLARRRRWIIASVVVCVAVAFVVTLTMVSIYEATATIELNKSGSGSLELGLAEALSQQLGSGGDLGTDLQTEMTILQSDTLILSVIEKLKLGSQPPFTPNDEKTIEKGSSLEESPQLRARLLGAFKGGLRVKAIRGTRLIQVTYASHDPKQAAQIANALIESYKSHYLQSHYDATSEASDWLGQQLSELKANVEDSEKKLTDFERASGILSFQTDSGSSGQIHSTVIQKLDALNTELTAAEGNSIEKEAIFHIARAGNDDAVLALANNPLAVQSNSMVLTQGGGLSALQQMRQKRNELEVSLSEASTTYGANNRRVKELQIQIDSIEKQINEEMKQIVKRAEADSQLAKQTEDEIRRRFDQQLTEASKLNEKTVEFAVLSQEASSRKKLYDDLYTKLQEANVSAGIKATNITIVDPARTQASPISPRRNYNLELGLLSGVFIGLVLAFTVDSIDRTVVNPLEVEEITGVPVIGIIPTFGQEGKAYGARRAYGARSKRERSKAVDGEPPASEKIWMLQYPESIPSEAFRSLRTAVLLSRPGGGPKVILVTSCIPGEGKSTVTVNLGVSFAQHARKVIIIEADMRRPTIKRVLNVSNETGLSSVLAGSITLDQGIQHGVQVPTLDVMAAGPRPPMPSELLGSPAFDQLLEELRSRYDIILIDSPPALLLTDAVSIASKTDATLWVARAGVVTRPQLARVTQLIQRNSIPIIGFVLNRMDSSVDPYGYGYEYGYHYKDYGAFYAEEKSNDA